MGKGDVPALIFRGGKTVEGWGGGNRDPNTESCPAAAVEGIPVLVQLLLLLVPLRFPGSETK